MIVGVIAMELPTFAVAKVPVPLYPTWSPAIVPVKIPAGLSGVAALVDFSALSCRHD